MKTEYKMLSVFTMIGIGLLITLHGGSALSPDGLSLLAFKSAVGDDPSAALAGWDDSDPDPCRWTGVTCANFTGFATPRVIGVALSGKNVTGYIPSELGSLIFLRRLNLHGNRLSGSIPSQLFNATSLHSLFLYDNNFSGPIPPSICDLPHLQNLDISKNSLSGPLPTELRNCRQLQRLLLQQNHLSGGIPAGIWPEMVNLVQLDLSSNQFQGTIPPNLSELDSLGGTLNLSHNRLSGSIPSSLGNLPSAVSLDLRYNNLSGEIPQDGTLANQGPTAFLNNPGLCGFPLQIPCEDNTPGPAPGRQTAAPVTEAEAEAEAEAVRGRLRPGLIVLISVADAAGVALIGLLVVYAYWRVREREDDGCSCTGKGKLGGGDDGGGGRCAWWRRRREGSGEEEEDEEEEGGGGGERELVAIDKGFKFELEELLRASAYVLGKGGRGIVYKVVLGNGVPVAVRRLGEGEGQRYKEFAAEVAAIGRLRHPNVVRLRAYYWAPDEKLLITDFISNGNLATALRGRSGQPILSWSNRLRIAKGAARGLAYLHDCSPRKFVHGDIKPSNILLDGDYNPHISDFGLIRLISIAGNGASSSGLIGGALPYTKPVLPERPNNYRAPEARPPGARPTQKWDVYSLGVVLLELLTGKPPEVASPPTASSSSMSPADTLPELVRWVRKGFEDANPLSEMVDPALLREVHAKKEVLSVFHLALACTEIDPESRPRMKTVSESLDRIGS